MSRPGRLGLAVVLGAALLLLAVALLLALGLGVVGGRLAFLDLTGGDGRRLLVLVRLPRAAAAAVVGGALAAAGVALQGLLRNPLAEPYTVGISSGAALGAIVAIRLGLQSLLGSSAVAALAFSGALLSLLLVWRLGQVGRGHPATTLLLAGISVAMTLSAVGMLLQSRASFAESYRIVRWLMGGLDWIPAREILRALPPIAVGLLLVALAARDLNALAAGEETAASLGVSVERTTRLVYAGATLLVGAAVAVAGPVGFVGLIVPHIARRLVGPDHRVLLPIAVVGGAAFLLLADTAARTLSAPEQIPVGVLTAILGGPFFLFLLAREGRA